MSSDMAVGIKDRDAKKRIAATGSVIGAPFRDQQSVFAIIC